MKWGGGEGGGCRFVGSGTPTWASLEGGFGTGHTPGLEQANGAKVRSKSRSFKSVITVGARFIYDRGKPFMTELIAVIQVHSTACVRGL